MKPLKLIDEAIKATDIAISQLSSDETVVLHSHEPVLKATTNEPDFKVNTQLGEGEATKDELKYRQDLQNLLKQVWKERDKLDDEELYVLIDKLFLDSKSDGKQLAESFITTIYTTNAKNMQAKLKKLKIKKEIPKNSKQLKALIVWQQFAIEKMGIELYYGILNQRFGKAYFEAAYNGNPKEKT